MLTTVGGNCNNWGAIDAGFGRIPLHMVTYDDLATTIRSFGGQSLWHGEVLERRLALVPIFWPNLTF